MAGRDFVEVTFDSEYLKKLPGMLGPMAFANFKESVVKEADNFIPKDTGSLASSHYHYENKDSYVLGYGSSIPNDPMNKIAVYQHENALNHYGLPGKSMRIGVSGASLPGVKHFVLGRSINGDKKQALDYQKGYRQKKKGGQLQKYSSQFLTRGLEVVAGRPINEIIGDITLEMANNKG